MAQDTSQAESDTRNTSQSPEAEATMITRSLLRIALALVGFILLLFALGQAFGLDLLGMFAEFTQTWTGQWLLVAVFALLLIVLSMRGWSRDRRR
ncbi:hypothetical protein ACLI4Y_00155 [Natrialbaceae archaeon A-CW3]